MEQWRGFSKEKGEIIEKGYSTVPDRPEIGVEMDDETVKTHTMQGTPFFEPV